MIDVDLLIGFGIYSILIQIIITIMLVNQLVHLIGVVKMLLVVLKINLNVDVVMHLLLLQLLESLYAIKTKSENVIDFSPQQIIDCSSNGNNGCNGGNFPPSIRYILGQGGKIATLASYPYAGKKQTCKTSGINQINLGNIQYECNSRR